jgi:hypothetical protein
VNVSLHLRLAGARPAGLAEVHNDGPETVRLWRRGNSWGDTALRFEATGPVVVRVVRRALVYTRDVPATVELAAGESDAWEFDLGDGTWQAEAGADVPDLTGAHLQAVYEIGPSAEARDQQAWTGTVRSAPVLVGAG